MTELTVIIDGVEYVPVKRKVGGIGARAALLGSGARAALLGIDLKTGDVKSRVLDSANPVRDAQRLKESVGGEFPSYIFTIVADSDALDVYSDYLLGVGVAK